MYKVLLIEDEDIMREGVKMSINWAKIDCRIVGEASDGEMAVSQIKTLAPDIVLLDINMPLLNGLEVLQRCQIEKQVFATIIISGYNDFEKAKQAIKYGVTDYLLKPLDHEELIQALHRCKESLLLKRQYQTFKEKIHEVSERELFVFKQTEAAVQPSKSIRALLALIEERYDEKISVQDIADELGRSKTYLNQNSRQSRATLLMIISIGIVFHRRFYYWKKVKIKLVQLHWMLDSVIIATLLISLKNIHIYCLASLCNMLKIITNPRPLKTVRKLI